MKLVIAEKPSVASDIAKVIGAGNHEKGYYCGNGWIVTWLHGHLLEIAPTDDPGWELEKLPYIPKGFRLKPIAEASKEGGKKSDANSIQRLNLIKELADKCEGVVIATDAGREGESIARNVLHYDRIKLPCERLWISSLTEDAIAEGFEHLYPAEMFDNLAKAAMARAIADWLVGINGTRALTIICVKKKGDRYFRVLSVGRVQSPVLKMICMRHLERENFKSQTYWMLEGKSVIDGVEMKYRSSGGETAGHFDTKLKAQSALDDVLDKRFLKVDSIDVKRKQEASPLLHNLDSLQKIANQRYGYTLQETLTSVQTLYEKKYCSYPRTDSRYISEDIFRKVPSLLGTVCVDREYGAIASLLFHNQDKLSRRSVNDNKLTDHHALIITKNRIREDDESLTEKDRRIYDLILMRFLEAFAPDCIADVTVVKLIGGDGVEFTVRGRKEIRSGWKMINRDMDSEEVSFGDADKQELDMGQLPPLKEGQEVLISSMNIIEDKTRPLPLYTDATILTAMENAGKMADDKTLSNAISGVGLGTAATRSTILETLIDRDFVVRKNKSLVPTNLGLEVCNALSNLRVSDVDLTASWEMQLNDIAEGRREYKAFTAEVEEFVADITREIISSGGSFGNLANIVESMRLECPSCGGEVIIYEKAAKCNTKDCKFYVNRTICGKQLGKGTLTKLVRDGKTRVITGFVSAKTGKSFDAALQIDKEGHIEMVFDSKGGGKGGGKSGFEKNRFNTKNN